MTKIIESKSVRTSYVAGKEVTFVDGRAKVSDEVAKELLARPGDLYNDVTIKRSGVVDDGNPSMERLNIEFDRMVRAKRLPELRGWLKTKVGEVEPALLTMQQNGDLPEGQKQTPPPEGLVEENDIDGDDEVDEDSKTKVDEEEVVLDDNDILSIDGNTVTTKDGTFTVDDPDALKRMKKVLKKTKKKGKKKK